jgi:short-subunit dehydrogenase
MTMGRSAYVASKAAVNGFYNCLRHEVSPHGIDVTVVCPGSFSGSNFRKNNIVQLNDTPLEFKASIITTTVEKVTEQSIWAADRRLHTVWMPLLAYIGAQTNLPFPNFH